jgi:iron complex outermembrane receptor protein
VPGQSLAGRSNSTQLEYRNRFAADTLQVHARLFQGSTDAIYTQNFGAIFVTRGHSEWHGAELGLLATALPGHKLMLGLEVQDAPVTDQSIVGTADHTHDFLIHSPGYRVGLYAQDEWRIADSLSATVGARIDRNGVSGTQSSPRAALIWQASSATTLKALYGRAQRAPNAYERSYDDGTVQIANPALKGETIDTIEGVADYRVERDFAVRGSIYEWTMRDLVTLGIDPVRGIPQFQSGDKVRARGLELSADKTWESGARLRTSVSLQDAAYVNGGGLLNSPKVLGKLNLTAPLPLAGLRAGYELRYDSSRRSLDGTRLGGYAVSNLNLSTDTLARGLELALTVSNLFDRRYAQPAAATNWQNALEQDGRSLRVSLVQTF